jgi:hypothetical protein
MHMRERFEQEAVQQEILEALKQKTKRADLKVKTKLVAARERNNDLIDQIFESLFTLAISHIMSAIGFKTASFYVNSSARAAKWIADEKDAVALPWMINFIRLRPHLGLSKKYNNPIHLFHDFQTVLGKWDGLLVGMSSDEITLKYGVRKELLMQGIAQDLSKIIGTEDPFLLEKFYNYSVYANKQGLFNFELKLCYFLVFSVPLLRHAIIEPAIKPVFHKIYNLRFLFETPIVELTHIKAKDLISNAEKEKILLEKFAKRSVWLNYFMALGALTIALHAVKEDEWPSPELMIYISATIIKVIINKLQELYEAKKQTSVENKLKPIVKIFKDTLEFTKGDLELYRGKKLSNCYITFRANSYETLSDVLVAQVVKNTLFKHNILIIEHTQNTISFGLRQLTELEASQIKSQIKKTLGVRISIKLCGATRANQSGFSLTSPPPANTKTLSNVVEENETDESAKEYFRLLKKNDEVKKRHIFLNELFSNVKKQLQSLPKEDRFAKMQLYRLNHNIQIPYNNARMDELELLKIVKINPTKVSPQDKKLHIHIVKSFNTIVTYLHEIQAEYENYQNKLKDKLALYAKSSTSPKLVAKSNLQGTLFSPLANEKIEYNNHATRIIYKLLTFCDFEVADSALGKNIQINALLFEIVEFMKIRVKTHAQVRKDPSENFSQYIEIALSNSKNLINENLSLESLTILHSEVIEFSRALIRAVIFDNYDAIETNSLCARILKHGKELNELPENISDEDTITYSLITGAMIQTFKTYDGPLPDGMLLSAFCMVNLKAKTYDGYEQPLAYLEHLAQSRSSASMQKTR